LTPRRTIVCLHEFDDRSWPWVRDLTHLDLDWHFVALGDFGDGERARFRAARHALELAQRHDAAALVIHGPRLTMRVGALLRLRPASARVICWSFHYPTIPSRPKRLLFRQLLRPVTDFVAYSEIEATLYPRLYGLDPAHFTWVHWGIAPPPGAAEPIVEGGAYLSAVGRSNRDFATLFAAAARLPEVPFVVVTGPECIEGLDVPANVDLRFDLPLADVDRILQHCRFGVLTLPAAETWTGHSVLARTLFLGKAMVTTRSEGLNDYVDPAHALTYAPGDAEDLAARIRELWEAPARTAEMGRRGKAFAERCLTEGRIARHFEGLLTH
jgi:glycosyltransferase involved in cell wall biosynthesis